MGNPRASRNVWTARMFTSTGASIVIARGTNRFTKKERASGRFYDPNEREEISCLLKRAHKRGKCSRHMRHRRKPQDFVQSRQKHDNAQKNSSSRWKIDASHNVLISCGAHLHLNSFLKGTHPRRSFDESCLILGKCPSKSLGMWRSTTHQAVIYFNASKILGFSD